MADNLGARKDSGLIVICMVPSINKTQVGPSVVPIPYPVTIDLSNHANFSKNVNFNGDPACPFNADTSKVTGDEVGKLGGVKSGTQGAKAEPKDKSSSVKINKQYLIRCNDMFDMNNKNTIGRLVCAPPPPAAAIKDDGEIEQPPKEEEESWWDEAWDNANDAYDKAEESISEGVDANQQANTDYAITTRLEGAVTGVCGVVETAAGVVGIITPEPDSTKGGVLLVANGADSDQADAPQVWSGETTQSVVEADVKKGTKLVGLDPATASLMDASTSMLASPT